MPPGTLVVRPGKQVLDLRPDVSWHKGAAVRWILTRLLGETWPRRACVVYAGDDRTDEDVFEALASPAVTVKVGPHVHPTAARYRLDSIEDVYRCIRLLETWLAAPALVRRDDGVERRAIANGSHPAQRIVVTR